MKSKMINASNLHKGGGVQVAISFISEISLIRKESSSLDVLVSTEVHKGLRALSVDTSVFRNYSIQDYRGIRQLFGGLGKRLGSYDVVFTVFGPLYTFRKDYLSIVGFAQPWIIYKENPIYRNYSLKDRIKVTLKNAIQSFFYKKSDALIVELPHVRRRLKEMGWNKEIYIVSNCISNLYKQKKMWRSVNFPKSKYIKVGFLGRDYPHKNTNILPSIKLILSSKYKINVDFFVTLTDLEWKCKSDEFRREIINIGPLSVEQCPSFYRGVDAVIFPSFLECFSATPIEAIYMGVPLFASNLGFVRDVCGEYAMYFDPEDPEDAAQKIATYFHAGRQLMPSEGLNETYFDPKRRAVQYLNKINELCGDE